MAKDRDRVEAPDALTRYGLGPTPQSIERLQRRAQALEKLARGRAKRGFSLGRERAGQGADAGEGHAAAGERVRRPAPNRPERGKTYESGARRAPVVIKG